MRIKACFCPHMSLWMKMHLYNSCDVPSGDPRPGDAVSNCRSALAEQSSCQGMILLTSIDSVCLFSGSRSVFVKASVWRGLMTTREQANRLPLTGVQSFEDISTFKEHVLTQNPTSTCWHRLKTTRAQEHQLSYSTQYGHCWVPSLIPCFVTYTTSSFPGMDIAQGSIVIIPISNPF